MNNYRPEYPNPQFERTDWLNLNGEWEFEVDNALCGIEKQYFERAHLDDRIVVPFCPESTLSGVGITDFMNCVWYRREIQLPEHWQGKRVHLHFGAVDYHTMVYINGCLVGEHKGGYTSFSFDITDCLKPEGNFITVCAMDDVRSGNQPGGKQCQQLHSQGCSYTRTTGIWQTVWLECTGEAYIKSFKLLPDIHSCAVNLSVALSEYACGCMVQVKVYYNGTLVGNGETAGTALHIQLSEKHLWSVGQGNLYDVELTVIKDGQQTDLVKTYFGLREVGLTKKGLTINGETVFGRWVLDQGFYPDGIYTAPTDEDLKNDILYSMELGFNGARLHEKIFEPRYLYWADKLGYLVWGEHANWDLDITDMGHIQHFLPEWLEALERDFNHPSIIGWCPFNETWDIHGNQQCDMVIKLVYEVTKAIDKTRPVIDTSGNFHVKTDIFDIHDYCQDPEEFQQHYSDTLYNNFPDRQTHRGEPYFVSEYGGIKWCEGTVQDAWGYGDAPKTAEEFLARYKGLTEALLKNERIMGFCYTQLYDVEQETNGLLTYQRQFKFDPEIFRKINQQKAAIEQS